MALSKCLLNADKQMTPITSLGSLLSIHVKYGWSKKYKRFFSYTHKYTQNYLS